MKKILCIIENLGSGGAERQLTGLAVMLKEVGYTVKFITYIERQFYEPYLRSYDVDYELINNAHNKILRLYKINNVLKRFDPDVVISFLPAVNMTMCLFKLVGYKFKLIVSERSHTNELSIKQRLTFWLYNFADRVVANSYSETDNIAKLAPKLTKKMHTITNFVETDKFTPIQDKSLSNNFTNIVSVARVIPVKNILNYICAIRIVVDRGYNVKALWVGAIHNDNYYRQCVNLIKELDLDDNFSFKPQTENIVDEYQKADIFCLPSLYEGFPNVICEAMSCGLPVVCSNVCDNPYIVEDGRNGFLFNPTNIDSISKALINMLELDEIGRKNMGQHNRLHAKEKLSTHTFLNKYITIIKKL